MQQHSRFLIGAYNHKDLHVLKSALRLTALLLESLPNILYSFNKEGGLYGIEYILSEATRSSSSDQDPSPERQCYVKSFQTNAQTVLNCSLEEGCVYHLSQKIKDKYIASNNSGLREGSRKVSELTYKLDGYLKQTNGNDTVEREINDIIQEILKVFTEESISVFDLISMLIQSYSALECPSECTYVFRVIPCGKKETWVDAPKEGLVTSPGMKIRFVNDTEEDMGEEEDQSKEEGDEIVVVDSFSSLKEIQEYLFERGYAKEDKQVDGLIFHLEGNELYPCVTLYQAIIGQKIQWNKDFSVDKLWEEEHTLRFTRGPSFSITTPDAAEYDQSSFFRHMFCYEPVPDLKKLSPVHEILFLLKLLEGTNRLMPHIICRQRIETFASSEDANMLYLYIAVDYISQNDFENINLCKKLQIQMRDLPVIGVVPSWFVQLIDSCPFLFSFDTRCKYFKLAAYGQQPNSGDNSRNMQLSVAGWATRNVFVDRNSILKSIVKLVEESDSFSGTVLEVQFHNEIGVGHGPTMEFYTLACESFQKPGLGMWRGDEGHIIDDQPNDLLPHPYLSKTISEELLQHFRVLGYIVGRALQDGRLLDLNFSKAFYKLIIGKDLSLYDIEPIDATIDRTMKEFHAIASRKKHIPSAKLSYGGCSIKDLNLTFTSVPGCPDTDLSSTDSDINDNNLGVYVSLVTYATVGSGISSQIFFSEDGLDLVFPMKYLHIFTEELEHILCGEHDSWTQSNELENHLEFGQGFITRSPPLLI
ncbi:E3 ubiquitin-protein ligase upl4 [Orobanche gracilis]